MNNRSGGILLIALVIAVVSATLSHGADDIESRRQDVLNGVWQDYQKESANPGPLSGKNAFFRAEALFELGKTAEGLKLVNRGLDQLVPGNKENRWIYGGNTGFNAYPGLDCYLRYGKFLDEPTKQRYREIYTGGAFYTRLSTSNHVLMAAVSRYLATIIWGADAFHPNPWYLSNPPKWDKVLNSPDHPFDPDRAMFFTKDDPTGEKFVREHVRKVSSYGPGEYASRPYGAMNVLPLLTLAECALDPEVRKQALEAYQYSLLQLAPAYLHGSLATFAPRSYPDAETQAGWGIADLVWFYFGGVSPKKQFTDNKGKIGEPNDQSLRAATTGYRIPDSIQTIGTDRSQPYGYRSIADHWALNHWVNKTYALFSRSPKYAPYDPKDKRYPFQGQSYPCGVMWDQQDPAKGNHLWITCPAADDAALMNIHTHGVTKYEEEVLYRDALLFVFNIPADYLYPYALGYVPGGYLASLSDGNHLFFHYGSVLIAVSSTAPITWDPKAGIRSPATMPNQGDSEFRIMARQSAVAIETVSPDDFSGKTPTEALEAFKKQILASAKIGLQEAANPTARYTDRHGNTLSVTFNGEESINGTKIDYSTWPRMESPWTKQLCTDAAPEIILQKR